MILGMQAIAWFLLAITSLSLLARKEGIVFSFLFFLSTIVGFIAFGFLKGLDFVFLLFTGALIFYIVERFLSMGTAAKLAKEDLENAKDVDLLPPKRFREKR